MGDGTKKKEELVDSTMSLGDHLEELRMRLLYALAGLAVGVIIGFCFGKYVIAFMERPYLNVIAAKAGTVVTDPNEIIRKSVTGKTYTDKPAKPPDQLLQTLAPADGIISYIKIATITGLLLSSPWVFYHIWMFIAAGLYTREKKYVYYAAPFSAVLFVCGALFFIIVVAPLTLGFLVSFNERFLGVKSQFTFQYYISFITHLMLVFGIAFQTPTAIFFLNRTGLVSLKALRKSRKYILLIIFIVAAMATPPDVVSQVTLAIPLYALFELGILLSYLSKRSKAAKEAGAAQ
jgi:sec-independent protein translocase protein TatC